MSDLFEIADRDGPFRTTIFLGAGFSKWCCDLPLVSQLFDFDIEPDTEREARRLRRIESDYQKWRVEYPSENPEQFIEFMQRAQRSHQRVNWYITRRLTEPFVKRSGRRGTWYINSYHVDGDLGIKKARSFLNVAASGVAHAILTTNYDMVAEYALGPKRFHYGVRGEQIGFSPYPYPRPLFLEGHMPIMKLHGSVNFAGNQKFPDSRCGLSGDCSITPPHANKKPRNQFPSIWNQAKRFLRESKRVIFFGFAFNEYDADILELLADNLHACEMISLIDVTDHRPRIARLFPNSHMNFLNAAAPLNREDILNVSYVVTPAA